MLRNSAEGIALGAQGQVALAVLLSRTASMAPSAFGALEVGAAGLKTAIRVLDPGSA
jgi:hypothetical protein